MTRKILAWCVHLYTGMGLVCAAAIALCIFRGTPEDIRQAFLWMLLATLIDATDGTLARAADVKHVLPGFDGRRLDDLIDFQTYTTLPLLLIWRTAVLPPGYEAWLLLALLASGYGFSQAEAKTEDGFFLGFPSYWNIVAFYLYMLGLPPFLALGIVVVCAVLTFVPTKYLYPSIGGPLSKVTIGLGAVWTVIVLIILSGKAPNSGELVWISLFYPMYYMGASWLISLRGARTG
ncbi:MAG: CDP-alcohol phosphatidyltransferase [Armatimonadetes bacterium]|nr:CDP-alcohol phosphatidyltransferase [Armatimonadota bacterium]